MADRFVPENLNYITWLDEIKFVILDRHDFDWSVEFIISRDLFGKTRNILFSPVFGNIDPASLADWIMESGLNVRLQLQIHKYLWHPDERRR